jgi:SAM-dependent methyltransferase
MSQPVSGGMRQRLSIALRPYFKPTRSDLMPVPWRYLLMRPVPFELWFRLRAACFLLRRRWGVASGTDVADGWPAEHRTRVIEHNFGQRWLFNRGRTEKLMNVLRSIGSVSPESRVLVIGPRNEAELLLLSLYGFRMRNITGIDLLSYSPRIQQMDMHAMRFADNAFDIVYTLYTLPYAYDLPKACAEIVRVIRPGGFVAAGFQHTADSLKRLRAPGSELRGGIDELLGLFGPHVDHVYWQELDPTGASPDDYRATTIFRVRK